MIHYYSSKENIDIIHSPHDREHPECISTLERCLFRKLLPLLLLGPPPKALPHHPVALPITHTHQGGPHDAIRPSTSNPWAVVHLEARSLALSSSCSSSSGSPPGGHPSHFFAGSAKYLIHIPVASCFGLLAGDSVVLVCLVLVCSVQPPAPHSQKRCLVFVERRVSARTSPAVGIN